MTKIRMHVREFESLQICWFSNGSDVFSDDINRHIFIRLTLIYNGKKFIKYLPIKASVSGASVSGDSVSGASVSGVSVSGASVSGFCVGATVGFVVAGSTITINLLKIVRFDWLRAA